MNTSMPQKVVSKDLYHIFPSPSSRTFVVASTTGDLRGTTNKVIKKGSNWPPNRFPPGLQMSEQVCSTMPGQ